MNIHENINIVQVNAHLNVHNNNNINVHINDDLDA